MTSYATTAQLIAAIESGGNAHALRFEPGVYRPALINALMTTIAESNDCDIATARIIYATSFGIYQIMGFNLYSICNYKYDVFAFVDDEHAQNVAFNTYLNSRKINFSLDQLRDHSIALKFAMAYNGSAKYAALIAEKLRA